MSPFLQSVVADDAPSLAQTIRRVKPPPLSSSSRPWNMPLKSAAPSSTACPLAGAGFYRPRHNPFVFFQDVVGNPPSKDSAACAAHHRDLNALASDLASGNRDLKAADVVCRCTKQAVEIVFLKLVEVD